MFQYHLLKAYAKLLTAIGNALWYLSKKAREVSVDVDDGAADAASDAKLAARRHYEDKLIEAAQEHEFKQQHSANLRARATSVEVQSGAHYTQTCKSIRDKLVELHEEII